MDEEKDKQTAIVEDGQGGAAPSKSKRDVVIERVRAKYPDDDYTSDEDLLFGRIGEMEDGYEKELGDMRKKNDEVYGFLKDNPELGAVFAAIRNGEHPVVAMRKYFDDDDFNMREGDEHYQAYMSAAEERKKAAEERRKLLEEMRANEKISEQNIREYAEENGLTEDETKQLAQAVYDDMNSISRGLISKDYWGRMRKAYRHDEDVQNALAAGEIKGRNEKIDGGFRKQGDGLPEPSGAGSPREEPKEEEDFTSQRLRALNTKINEDSKWNNSGYKKVK